MTREEAAVVLAALTAAFPTFKMTEPTARAYLSVLARKDRDHAANAVDRLIVTEQYFPSIARLVEVVRIEADRDPTPRPPSLETPRSTRETAREWIAKTRDDLRGE